MQVSQLIVTQLRAQGVKRIYGVVGDAIFGLLDALGEQDDVEFIAVKHESVAALMASAEAKYTGTLGVCIAQMGPGIANLINGLGDAYLDGAPVLAITGQAPVKKLGTAYKQYIHQQQLVQALSHYSELIVHPAAVHECLQKAMLTSLAGKTVSHLAIPADLFSLRVTPPAQTLALVPEKRLLQDEPLQEVVTRMRRARRPLLLVGNRVRRWKHDVLQLARQWGGGVVTAYGAVGIFTETDDAYLGGLGEGGNPHVTRVFLHADVVFVIGTSWWPAEVEASMAEVIQLGEDALELGGAVPVSLGVSGNMHAIVQRLCEALGESAGNEDWFTTLGQTKRLWSRENEQEGKTRDVPLHPATIVRTLEAHITDETIVTLDEGDSTLWFMRNFRGQCAELLLSKRWRTMGFGLPAALAAKLHARQQKVICVTGDGGLAMVLADLLTAVRYQLQIIVIVFNNGTLQMERNKMTQKQFEQEGTQITNPDFVALAKACGWEAYTVDSEAQLAQLLSKNGSGADPGSPVLIDVPTARVAYPDYEQA